MGLWQGIFLVIGCALAGLIVGLTIMYVLQKKKIKRYSIFQEKKNQAKPGVPGSSVATAANNTIIKSNGHEESAGRIDQEPEKQRCSGKSQRSCSG